MGDMADFALEQIETNVEMRDKHRRGDMSIADAYENGIVDELGKETESVTFKTCRCCNKGRLTWDIYNGKWLLFDNGKLHECPVNKLNRGMK